MGTIRLYLEPYFKDADRGEGGIRRVVDAQRKFLPDFGVNVVDSPKHADITAGHGTIKNLKQGVPFVSHSHGLHWSDYKWDAWAHQVNRAVIDAMLAADAITVPSQWVKRAYTRGMMRDLTTVYHGVDPKEWAHNEASEGYVLWNKPRHDIVSDSAAAALAARQMSDTKFVVTFAPVDLPNITKIGALPYGEMKPIIKRAGVYLTTARETFGIGTLEALAAGLPIAGWKHGGQAEIVIEGETGYLAEPGNYEQLAECIRKCFEQRKRLSANARDDVKARWLWADKIEQYANIYKRAVKEYSVKPKVSVLVTCHNLARYLHTALESVMKQTCEDWECLVIDDVSTDNTPEVVQEFVQADGRFAYHRTPENLKLSRARNFGMQKARGKYVINLDADDALTPNALAMLSDALDKDPETHIAYGGLDLMSEDGGNRRPNSFPPPFNWVFQMAHLNTLPYAAMMRRGVLDMTGGYRERQWRAEDAEMWCRATSFGWRAKRVTEEATLIYRIRADSKGALERKANNDIDGDWTGGFPWRIAASAEEGQARTKKQNIRMPNAHLIPFGAPEISGEIWNIPHHETPNVSIIIPLGANHERYVIDALDSVVAQTIGSWECIVVNDTGHSISEIAGAQYARIVSTKGREGAGVARNIGLRAARAPLVLFLDADDTLRPDALALMLERYAKGDCGYVYTDWVTVFPDGTSKPGRANDYNPSEWLYKGQHAVTVLVATEEALRVNGFDEKMPGWEDWDFFVKLNMAGVCGAHVAEGLLNYREFTGSRRGDAFKEKDRLLELLRNRYNDYLEGSKKPMPCGGGCGGAKSAAKRAISESQARVAQIQMEQEKMPDRVRMEFLGQQTGPIGYTVNGRMYYGANTPENKFVIALRQDVEKLTRLGIWRIAVQPPPEPEQVQADSTVSAFTAPPEAVQEKPPEPAVVEKPPEPAPVTQPEPLAPPPKRGRKAKRG